MTALLDTTGFVLTCKCKKNNIHCVTEKEFNKIAAGKVSRCKNCLASLKCLVVEEPAAEAEVIVSITPVEPVVEADPFLEYIATLPQVEPVVKSKIERVREIILANPTAKLVDIVKLVQNSDIGMSPINIRGNTRAQMMKMGRQL